MKFVCENCGHLFEGKFDSVKDRQCSKCRSHRVYNKKESAERILELTLELKEKIYNLVNILG